MASTSAVQHPLMKFLVENTLEQYFESFVDNGYDDLEFLTKMDESEVLEMLQECDVNKKGHVKKFIAILKAKKYTNEKTHEEMKEQQQGVAGSENELQYDKCK